MIPFALEDGLLDATPAIRLFAAAQMSQVTGTFTFSRENTTKWIEFKRGKLTGARSSQLNESLGRLLVTWGWVSHEVYVNSLDRMDTGKEKHGQILASMGALDQNRIPEALRKQHMTRLADAASWTAGRYHFSPGENASPEEFPLWPVFQEGIFKRFGRTGLEQQAAELKGVAPRRAGGMFEPLLFAVPDALKLYDRFDGKKTLAELAKSEANQLAFLASLLVLLELGVVEMAEAPVVDPLEKAYKKARQLAPADLLQLPPQASPEDIHQAMGRLLNRFPAEKFAESRYFQPLVTLVEDAGHKLIHSHHEEAKAAESVSPLAERAFQMGKDHLEKRQLASAVQKFAEAVHVAPHVPEMQGYLAWAQFLQAPQEEARRFESLEILVTAAAKDPDDADLQTFSGALLKLSGKFLESESALLRALELKPEHVMAKRELESVRLRLGRKANRNAVNMDAVRSNAKIVVQRWIGGHAIIANFDKDEVRIGSGMKDDLAVSEQQLPQVTPAHCNLFLRENQLLYVRRNGSAGLVLVNGKLLQPREEVHVTAEDTVVLGDRDAGQVLEFRVLDRPFLSKMRKDLKKAQNTPGEANTEWIG